ncbi:MAG TPA: hypothetical protein VFN49_07515 [Candidatus Aquilonibacter sp.]|nr:hypothetical protein [Candidatus Aquilonibacter sp.]
MPFRFVNHPLVLCAFSLLILWTAAYLGSRYRKQRDLDGEEKDELNLVAGGVLTLLGLIIGFSFSMAVGRFDLRMASEANEANAIGTEYLRAELLDADHATALQTGLARYLAQRIEWYRTRDARNVPRVERLQNATEHTMWAIVRSAATARETPVRALVVSGMNDVIDDAGYTKAAWANRIPRTAWVLMILIAAFASVLLGYNVRSASARFRGIYLLPITVSIALFLVADLDSTRGGLIMISPNDLLALQDQINSQ